MPEVIAWLGDLPAAAVYLVAAALVFAETGLIIGLALPGEVTLIFVGFLAYVGALEPVSAFAVMLVAALLGDGVAFAEGRRIGPRLRASRLGRWVGEPRWERASDLLVQHQGRAVVFGRFIAFARTLLPRLAGMSGLRYRRFVLPNVLGAAAQVGASILVGYVAGTSFAFAAEIFGRATGALLLLVLVIVGLVVFGRYLGRHPDPVTAFGDRLGTWGPLRVLDRGYDAAFRWLTARIGVGGAVGVNVLLGVGVLLGLGAGLTWSIDQLVSGSGFPLVDPLIVDWVAAQRTPATVDAALTTLSVLRGSILVVVVGLVGLALNSRPARWRADLLGVVGTVGAFIPLVILAVSADWVRPASVDGAGLFPNQVTLVTASTGMLAWLLTRRGVPWAGRVAAWMVTIGVVILVSAARLYVGWNWPSEILASILLGSLWVVVFAVAWRTRDRIRAADPQARLIMAQAPGRR
ncbi:MAG TPA: VTT domain-containing protein [Micromonosporaceae bacterium]